MATIAPARARPGRGAELGLLILALLITVYSYAQVGLNMTGHLPADIVGFSGWLVGLSLLMHLVLRWRAPYADPVLLPCAVALNGIGLAMIYRLSISYAKRGGSLTKFSQIESRQFLFTTVGMAVAMVVLFILRDHRTLRRFTYTFMLAGIVLLLLPLVPKLGSTINSARIWIQVFGVSFQPAELAKLVLAIFFAGYLVTHRDSLALAGPKILGLRLPRARDLGPLLLAWGTSMVVLVFEKDLGTALLFFGLFLAMLYVATDRVSWVVIGLLLFAAGVTLAFMSFGHVQDRVDIWLHPLAAAQYNKAPGGSQQLVQGMFGMASGGLFGTGWGLGRPDLIPLAHSDFIFASLAEELGLTGVLAILVIFLLLAERGMRTAIGVRDGFGKLLAMGLAFVLALQFFVVVGGVTRVIPLTGLTIPFVTYGGSSLLVNWTVIAVLLRISDGARRPPPQGEMDPTPVLAELDRQQDANVTEVVHRP